MDLINATNMQAGYTMGMQPDGREFLVVVVKGTFTLPLDGSEPKLAEEQLPLIEADEFTGEPGLSAPIYEADYALRKARCDVVLNGSAYAPGGREVKKIPVGLRVGSMQKRFDVIGDRFWQGSNTGYSVTSPRPFSMMPVSYDRAFGGSDNCHPDKKKHSAYMPNPIGRGYHRVLAEEIFDGTPLPNTQAVGEVVSRPSGNYRPMAFGPIGRGWEPRYKLAGTYDQHWQDNVFPFLPADFSEAYYQCAPADQQIEYLRGGETVELVNLTPQGRTIFTLPKVEVPVVFFLNKGDPHHTHAVADTLVLEPDLGRFTITWRASLPLRKNLFEVPQVLAGRKSRGWWRARELGKTYYPSLGALVRSKRAEAVEEEE